MTRTFKRRLSAIVRTLRGLDTPHRAEPTPTAHASAPPCSWADFTTSAADIDWSEWGFPPPVAIGACGCSCKRGAPCSGCGHARCGRPRRSYGKAA